MRSTLATASLTILAAANLAHGQSTVPLNGSFEEGTFDGGISFAGGRAQSLATPGASTAPVFPEAPFKPWLGGYAPSNVKAVNWVESSAAHEGSKFVYISGIDSCLNLIYTQGVSTYYNGLNIGETYEFCIYAASAQDLSGGASAVSQQLRIEHVDNGNTVITPFDLAANGAWSDTTQTVIPWQKICYSFTPTDTSGVIAISTALGAGSAIVLDGASFSRVSAVPEPASALLGLLSLAPFVYRRKR